MSDFRMVANSLVDLEQVRLLIPSPPSGVLIVYHDGTERLIGSDTDPDEAVLAVARAVWSKTMIGD